VSVSFGSALILVAHLLTCCPVLCGLIPSQRGMCRIPFSQGRFRRLITITSFSVRRLLCLACLFGRTPGRLWRKKAHCTLADAYDLRVLGAREDNVEHVIHHLTKALENVSIEGPASKTDRFGKGPLDGYARSWSDLMLRLSSSYGERVKVS
jgi:hypothetical protein